MSATGGFITGFGGIIAMPFTIPTEFALLIYLQLRMVGAIAYLYGHDIQSDRIISIVGISLCGNKANDILQEVFLKELMISYVTFRVTEELFFSIFHNNVPQ